MARVQDDRRARRLELGVYAVAGISYLVAGYVLRSAVLNWIVGPAWFVAWVVLVTPLVLRLAGLEDPDGPGVPLPEPDPALAHPGPGQGRGRRSRRGAQP